MKRIIGIAFAVMLTLCSGMTARAQIGIPTTDAGTMGAQIQATIQDAMQHAEDIKNAIEQIKQATSLNSTITSTYRLISATVKDASIIRDVYQNYLMVQEDIERVSRFVDYVNSNHISFTRLSTMYSIADKVLADAVNEMDYITKTLLNPAESMSLFERLEKIGQLNEKMSRDRHVLDLLMKSIEEEGKVTDAKSQSEDYENDAFGRIKEPVATITPGLNLSDIEELIDPRPTTSSSPSLKSTTDKFTDADTVDHIFNIASLLIGIIAVGYSVWNFVMVNSGERQKQDSQFKVFAGMLIGILLLQALKAMFF